MSVKQNWHGIFVEDNEERKAYVSKQDAVDIAGFYKLDNAYKRAVAIAIAVGWVLGFAMAFIATTIFK